MGQHFAGAERRFPRLQRKGQARGGHVLADLTLRPGFSLAPDPALSLPAFPGQCQEHAVAALALPPGRSEAWRERGHGHRGSGASWGTASQ